ncbi:hypothetical protein Tco_0616151 [Tanacetum coccineum]
MSPGNVARDKLDSDSDTVASPSPRAENEPRGQNELSQKQKAVTEEGDDLPLHIGTPPAVGVRAPESPIWVAGRACRPAYPQEDPEPRLKAITDRRDAPELPLHYPSWRQMPPERKAGVVAKYWDPVLTWRVPTWHRRCHKIYAGIQQHLQKIYNGKKAALKERYWVPEEDETYDLERLRRGRPIYFHVTCLSKLGSQLCILEMIPRNLLPGFAQNKQNRAKSKVVCRQGSRSIAALRDMH